MNALHLSQICSSKTNEVKEMTRREEFIADAKQLVRLIRPKKMTADMKTTAK